MLFLRQSRMLRRQFRRLFHPRPKVRRIVLHIGAHKTGTTYIQQTLESNRARLPLPFEMVPRRQRHLHRLTRIAASVQTEVAFKGVEADLQATALRLANCFDRVETLLISHEGLPGPMPGREQFPGLYPMAHLLIPAIVRGFEQSGASVSVVFYKRRFHDWKASLYRYRFRESPDRAYHPARFAARSGLPEDWQELITRLRQALPKDCLHVVSFEQDRETGLLGTALYNRLGLSLTEISALKRLAPQNVSRSETQHDSQFEP